MGNTLMPALQSRSTDSSIFSGGEDEFLSSNRKLYRLPSLQHVFAKNHYIFVALYRKRSLNKFTPILEIDLWEEWMMSESKEAAASCKHREEKYPFMKLIENSVLPYLGQEEDKEHLMRKYSKANSVDNMNNTNQQVRQNHDSESTNNLSDESMMDHASSRLSVMDQTENVRVEEFHFMHPNDEESTIHIDVVTLKRSKSLNDQGNWIESTSHNLSDSDMKITLDDIEIIGAVCDGVKLERRRLFMSQLKELCEKLLMEYYSTSTNSSNSSSVGLSTTKKEKALSSYSEGEDQFMKKMFKPKTVELITCDSLR
ncbi:hypothetical protein C9374_009299 [Naegleria lovaniensis]|uniref:Uncharacterized protein n=1 Tax=Naegleria lovaniensis TaxID=51637 RepID=A0AA88GF77_NAELO|nr:uncharacterized protein C9374_009299 [Naegleria lovaniensis]KAG2377388.1 hypothetical protein C9374_009299 [Naegleria lovaniensis]